MMRLQPVTILISILCLVFMATMAYAGDYKDWIPLLPDTISGMKQSGDPHGLNTQSESESWTGLQQDYSDGSKKIELQIVSGPLAPQVKQFHSMKGFSYEDGEKIVKTDEISGNDAIFEVYKNGKRGAVLVAIGQETVISIQSFSVGSKENLISCVNDVPTSDIFDAIE
ncbi:MAG: hypothetical protein V5B78_01600 [Desulfohalobiaceae bacterium]